MPGNGPVDPIQTLAVHRVFQHALHQVESAEKEEVGAGEMLAAILQEPDSHAVTLLRAQGISRLDLLKYLSHGVTKAGAGPGEAGGASRPAAADAEDEDLPADPLAAFATNLTERAAQGKLDPLIGREAELTRAIHILARRRKNNPILVGETGVGKTAIAEGLARKIVNLLEDEKDSEG